jgi:hypothetical protein
VPEGQPWSDEENDVTVGAYFALLEDQLRRAPTNKAQIYRQIGAVIGRNANSVERKFQNISAVLLGLGLPWASGLVPLANFQLSLVDAVERWLRKRPAWPLAQPSPVGAGLTAEAPPAAIAPGFALPAAAGIIPLGPPPTLQNAPPPIDPATFNRFPGRFDAATRDARNRALGPAGEEAVLRHERATLRAAGRADLASAIVWTAEEQGDGAGYDIRSFEPDGRDRLIEVKTTAGWERTPFHITRNELAVADERRDAWVLFRLYDVAREPRAFELRPPLDRHVELIPSMFMATPR